MKRVRLLHPLCSVLAACALVACSGAADRVRTPDEAALTPLELLGKRVFEDPKLSRPAGVSCASCHDPEQAFAGNHGSRIGAVALGSRPDQFGDRNVPTIMYASLGPAFHLVPTLENGEEIVFEATGGQFWDGRADDLAEQAKGPLLNPREMNNPDALSVLTAIRNGEYAGLFRQVYGRDAFYGDVEHVYDQVGRAVAAYEKTARFHPFTSRFDDYLRGKAKLSELELRGFELFKDPKKGNCISCHAGKEDSRNPADWPFTNFTYDILGVPRNVDIPNNADPNHFDLGLCKREGLVELAPPVYPIQWMCGAFKTPTLRNVTRTAPYMHNGFFHTLKDVVSFYATRDTNPELWYPKGPDGQVLKFNDLPEKYHINVNRTEAPYVRPGQPRRLSDDDVDALVAFLQTLTDRDFQ